MDWNSLIRSYFLGWLFFSRLVPSLALPLDFIFRGLLWVCLFSPGYKLILFISPFEQVEKDFLSVIRLHGISSPTSSTVGNLFWGILSD